jgi:hypothetical protein
MGCKLENNLASLNFMNQLCQNFDADNKVGHSVTKEELQIFSILNISEMIYFLNSNNFKNQTVLQHKQTAAILQCCSLHNYQLH